MADKQFIGNGWEYKYGINISIKKEDFDKLPVNDRGYVSLTVGKKKNPEPGKATHWVALNDYKPGEKKSEESSDSRSKEDLPF